MGNPDYDMRQPRAIVIVSAPKDNSMAEAENAMAFPFMQVAARELGIGMVWTNQLRGYADESGVRAVLDKFEIPSDHKAFAVYVLGKVDEFPIAQAKTESIVIID